MRLLVVNPYASGVTEERIADVTAALGDVEVRRTEHGGHATDLVREHADAEAVYVFSGDGGFNEVLNGIGPDTPVGFVPGGGANVLPRALGLPGDPVLAAEQLAKGRTRRISVGRVNGRRFAFSAGIGIDAEAVRRIEARGRAEDGARAGNLAVRLGARAAGRAAPRPLRSGARDPRPGPRRVRARRQRRSVHVRGADSGAGRAGGQLRGWASTSSRRAPVSPFALPRLLGYALLGRGQAGAGDVLYAHDLDRIEVVCDAPMPLQADGEDLGDVTSAVFEAERGGGQRAGIVRHRTMPVRTKVRPS